jgi:hypothetical protein
MLNRKRKEVYVGQLPRSMNSGRVHYIRIQQATSSAQKLAHHASTVYSLVH